MRIQIKRVYAEPAKGDGLRVLVDRIWPRGMTKEKAQVDEWEKELAPTAALRKWFGHDPAKWEEFQKRYLAELEDNPAVHSFLADHKAKSVLTLLYGAKDEEHNQAVVLKRYFEKLLTKGWSKT